MKAHDAHAATNHAAKQIAALTLALALPLLSVAAEPGDAAQSILAACIKAASSGSAVDTADLLNHFKADRKGVKLTALAPLPPMQLLINNGSTIPCVLLGKAQVATSDFARAVKEQIETWPRFEHKPLKSLDTTYIARGDAARGVHDVAVFIETPAPGVWQVTVWDNGLPAADSSGSGASRVAGVRVVASLALPYCDQARARSHSCFSDTPGPCLPRPNENCRLRMR